MHRAELADGDEAGRVRAPTFVIWPLGKAARELAKKRSWSVQVAEEYGVGQWSAVVKPGAPGIPPGFAKRRGVERDCRSTAWATR